MTARPDVAALVADPTQVPLERIPEVIGELERAKAVLWSRLTSPVPVSQRAADDRLLSAQQVHEQTQLSVAWMYRHANALPFTRRVGRKVLFSQAGLTKWLATRRP